MLIIAGTFDVEPDQREAFLAGRVDAMRRSRQEPGCEAYVFSADPVDPGRVYLFERWETKEALTAHLAGMREWPRAETPVKVLSTQLQQYEIAAVGAIGS